MCSHSWPALVYTAHILPCFPSQTRDRVSQFYQPGRSSQKCPCLLCYRGDATHALTTQPTTHGQLNSTKRIEIAVSSHGLMSGPVDIKQTLSNTTSPFCRVVVASTGKRSTQDLTGLDGDVIALEGNGWVVVRTSDGSETLRVQQRYLEKRPKDHSEVLLSFHYLLWPHSAACICRSRISPWLSLAVPEVTPCDWCQVCANVLEMSHSSELFLLG